MVDKKTNDRLASRCPDRHWQIRQANPAQLKPAPGNARVHPREQIERIKQSITEFGFTNPLLVDEQGNLICGHGRSIAAVELEMVRVPVITISDLSEAQIRAYVIADNAIAEKSHFSKELLRSELKGLIELGYDVEYTGIDTVEIDSLLNFDDPDNTTEADEEELIVALPNKPLTRLGDHWIIGKHHLLIGDARRRSCYEELLSGALVRCIFTDPPFNTPGSRISGLGKIKHGDFAAGSGELSQVEFERDFLRTAFRNFARVSEPGAIAFVCSDWRSLQPIWDAAEGVFVEPKNLCVWAKTNAGMGSFYRSQVEYVVPFLVSPGRTINNMKLAPGKRHRSNLWTYAGANTFRPGREEDLAAHPTVKPTKLVADAILDVTKPGDIVLDAYLGSGTTLCACASIGRIGYGLELDPKYGDVILRRVAKATGDTPRLIDGPSIGEVARERSIDWEA